MTFLDEWMKRVWNQNFYGRKIRSAFVHDIIPDLVFKDLGKFSLRATHTKIITGVLIKPCRVSPDFFKAVSFHVSFHVKFRNMRCCDYSINNPQNSCLVTWLLTWNITFWVKYSIKKLGSGGLEDLTFKISEGSDPNWSCPEPALLVVSVAVFFMVNGQKKFFGLFFWSIFFGYFFFFFFFFFQFFF